MCWVFQCPASARAPPPSIKGANNGEEGILDGNGHRMGRDRPILPHLGGNWPHYHVLDYVTNFLFGSHEPPPPTPEQAVEQQREAENNKRMGFNCLSVWDGSSTRLVEAVKRTLRDPSSFEHISTNTSPVDGNGKNSISMTFRARNGFGGMTSGLAMAEMVNNTCEVKVTSIDD